MVVMPYDTATLNDWWYIICTGMMVEGEVVVMRELAQTAYVVVGCDHHSFH